MGILNITPDSFYATSRKGSVERAIDTAASMLEDGATLLDIGGASTRPGAKDVEEGEEADRVLPVIEAVAKGFPTTWLSVDTTRASVARQAAKAGAHIINDVSAATADPDMIKTVAALGLPIILMHMQGTPATMQEKPQYGDVLTEVLDYLIARTAACRAAGIADVLLDPGFGFGKNKDHNFKLLAQLHAFKITSCPVVAGISRKRMICETLGVRPPDALNGTTAAHIIALEQGAAILRVHDVKPAAEAISIYSAAVEQGWNAGN